MMAAHSPQTTPMELYWCVWTMSMGQCMTTSGTLWMQPSSALNSGSLPLVSSKILFHRRVHYTHQKMVVYTEGRTTDPWFLYSTFTTTICVIDSVIHSVLFTAHLQGQSQCYAQGSGVLQTDQ